MPVRHRMACATVVAALVSVGCVEQSRVDPDAVVRIGGAVRGPENSPAADVPVRLGAGLSEGEGAFALLTLGLSCATGACTGVIRDTATDGGGRYTFELRGRDTQSTFGEAAPLLVSATGPTPAGRVSGPLVSARFRLQQETVELPPLALVDPGLTVAGERDVVARWSPARPPPYELTFEGAAATPVWRTDAGDTTEAVDGRVLEDSEGRVVVGGAYREAISGSDVEVRWRSPGVGYAAGAGPPPSRGRPCRYVDAGGRAAAPSPCGVTDGALATEAATPAVCRTPDACTPATAVVVDLGGAVPAELVVVRGCRGGCAVDVSDDGTTYRPAGGVADGFGALALDGRPVSAVRVGLGSVPSGVREVSVWGPRPGGPALRPVDDDLRAGLAEPYEGGRGAGDDDDGARTGLAVVAGVAAAAVLVALGFVLGRRRAPAGR